MRFFQHFPCLLLASVLAAALLAGCNNTGSRCSIQGEVRYDGATVDHGGIAFIPIEEGMRATAPIRDGRFRLDYEGGLTPGKYRVEIYWRKKTGTKVPGEGGHERDEVVQAIPAKYNTESELTIDIQPGRNTCDFDLKK